MNIGYYDIGLPRLSFYTLLVFTSTTSLQQHFDHIIETERTTTTRIKKKKIGSEMGIVNIEFTESLSALSFYSLDV